MGDEVICCRMTRAAAAAAAAASALSQKLGDGPRSSFKQQHTKSLLNDAVSRTTRSLASKQKLSDQRQLVRQQEVMKKQKKKKKKKKKKESSSWQTFMRNLKEKKESSSWQTFIRNLKEKEEEHKFEDDISSCSDFYHSMIRFTYDLPSDDDDDKRQFRLEQQLLRQQGKLNIRESRRFTPNERKEYIEKVDASEGFDVMNIPDDISEYNIIKPYPNFDKRSRVYERVKYSAKLALHCYNKQQQHNREENYYYQFVKVLKVNVRHSAGAEYYITFEAKPVMDSGDAPPKNFQACVYAGITETKVYFCRPEQ